MHLNSVLPILAPISTGGLKTFAPWPVWAGSTTEVVKTTPMPKKAAVRLWHRARDYDRQTRRAGHHGGAVGPAALAVLQSLIFDFKNFRTGRLDPSYAAIAKASNLCRRTVATAIKRLRDLGIVDWTRRCAETRTGDGRFVLTQQTNAYALMPSSGWQGYREPPDPPGPAPGTWGQSPPLPCVLTLAVEERRHDGGMRSVLSTLNADPTDALAAVLARIGRAVMRRETQ
jgi:Helix-turn-helix domain